MNYRFFKLGLILIFIGLAGFISADAVPRFFMELSPGYDAGIGGGIPFSATQGVDPTGTYYQRANAPVGNQDWELGGKIGIDIDQTVLVLLGGSYTGGTTDILSASTFYTSGLVAYNFDNTANWSSWRFSGGIRLMLAAGQPLQFFTGVGALVGVPRAMVITYRDQNPYYSNNTGSYTFNLDPGVGAYAELGAEVHFSDVVGMVFSATLDKISYNLSAEITKNSSGTVTTNYVDNPQINSASQTAADVANSTTSNQYYTAIKRAYDFSELSFQVGLTIRL